MDSKCGCWAILKRGVRGSCKSSASRDSANTIPRTSLVYDAGASNYIVELGNASFVSVYKVIMVI
ncbi:hypothetical protein SADUNF_Sadunf06G0048900 [Salix dunnii]|uniref:Uncharacterized protein n=1 Tax=Salix dunnii TaxID=1413687 RepID=A0A835K352_9ROSI|nr:hypothetical protein SADUNF_Sadunf06G0048900 [Salix dunnii]